MTVQTISSDARLVDVVRDLVGRRRRYLIAKTTTSVPIRSEKNAVTAIRNR